MKKTRKFSQSVTLSAVLGCGRRGLNSIRAFCSLGVPMYYSAGNVRIDSKLMLKELT